MKENWFENKLSQRLGFSESEIDLDGLWEDLERGRFPNGRKRSNSVFLPFLIAICVILVGYFSMFSVDTSLDVSPEDIAVKHQHNSEKEDVVIHDIDSYPNGKTNGSKNRNNTKNNHTASDNLQGVEEKRKSQTWIKKLKSTAKTKLVKNTLSNALPTSKIKETIPKTRISNEEDKFNTANRTTSQTRLNFGLLDVIQGLDKNISYLANDQTMNLAMEKSHLKRLVHSIGITGSYGLASSRLQPLGNQPNFILENRKDQEQIKDHFILGLSYQYQFQKGFFIKSGLAYQQYTSQYQFNLTRMESIVSNEVVQIIKRDDGTEEYINEDIVLSQSNQYRVKHYVKYRSARLPLLLGYHFRMATHWSISLAAGPSIGFALYDDSKLLANDPMYVDFDSFDSAGYTTQFNLEGHVETLLCRHISSSLSLNLGVAYNFDLFNRMNEASKSTHKLSAANLVVELQKSF